MESRYEGFKGICWDDAENKYQEYMLFSCKPTNKRLPATHIEDEDKSVKWNREFLEAHNKKCDNEVKNLNRKKKALIVEAEKMVKHLICEELEWKLSDDDIDRLFGEWYDRFHSDGFAYMCSRIQDCCADICEMDWWKKMKSRKDKE